MLKVPILNHESGNTGEDMARAWHAENITWRMLKTLPRQVTLDSLPSVWSSSFFQYTSSSKYKWLSHHPNGGKLQDSVHLRLFILAVAMQATWSPPPVLHIRSHSVPQFFHGGENRRDQIDTAQNTQKKVRQVRKRKNGMVWATI